MRTIIFVLALLALVTACATTYEDSKLDPQMHYGGSYRVRTTVSGGVHGK